MDGMVGLAVTGLFPSALRTAHSWRLLYSLFWHWSHRDWDLGFPGFGRTLMVSMAVVLGHFGGCTSEERTNINTQVVSELDKASEAWGVKVLRYEIRNITPPNDVLAAMEKQMRAEREKRAVILTSEGQRDAAINTAEGQKQQVIKASEATKQQQINEAEGQAAAILAVAGATAEGIRKVADAIQTAGGFEAVQLRVAEQYLTQFGSLAKEGNTLILPVTLSDVGSMIALAMNIITRQGGGSYQTPPLLVSSFVKKIRCLKHVGFF